MAGITVTGNKLLRTIRKEFEEQFPYLSLAFFTPEEWDKGRDEGGRIKAIKEDKRLSEVRLAPPSKGEKEISIHGRTLVKNLEDKLLETFGLCVLVTYQKGDQGYYTSGDKAAMSLTQLNKMLEEEEEG